ncbi:hypothetical protein JD844_028019 [Phrynosoma platyrhinos]|uniref:PH domain-containing protein n=1 Tax=Phrynosoma platyrhinos TaxID=52577 RepID=A0ABQ7SH93_PHRPL|nr:hypothetical protein JD844_028019 [Phrynosoma platyrhinos]
MKEEGPLRRRFSSCAGVSLPPRADGRKLVRNASFGGYNELSPVFRGFDRGKDDASQNKDDSAQSMSKSKSESKLYNGSEKDITAASTTSSSSTTKLTKKESLKVQKKNYREEKKRATKELLSTITDPSVIVMADWLKIRGTLKSWTKLWCVLKPGVLLIYKTPKNGQWVGTVLLNACELIERPSKKDGFCFKLFHPLEQSIWAVKGPKGEAVGSITQPLPSSYLIIRAASESDGRCWMDALELALKCSSLLKRTMIREGKEHELNLTDGAHVSFYGLLRASNVHSSESFPLNDSEIERHHFKDPDLYSDKSDRENDHDHDESDNDGLGESDTDTSERQDDSYIDSEPDHIKETTYVEEAHEELGEAGEASQTETVSEENKSLIWTLLKQVRPGMDLSKVVLPTFILETRSFLDKLSDYYYHADFLSEAALEENAYNRMKQVVKWYLSGFYKKPKVSHHPPISAFYVSNRKDGFCLSGNILAKSKFYGNSLSAILDGEGRLLFLNRGEEYIITMPYAHCKVPSTSVPSDQRKFKTGWKRPHSPDGHMDPTAVVALAKEKKKKKKSVSVVSNPLPDSGCCGAVSSYVSGCSIAPSVMPPVFLVVTPPISPSVVLHHRTPPESAPQSITPRPRPTSQYYRHDRSPLPREPSMSSSLRDRLYQEDLPCTSISYLTWYRQEDLWRERPVSYHSYSPSYQG